MRFGDGSRMLFVLGACTANASAAQPGVPPWASESWYLRRQVEPAWAMRGANVIDVRGGNVLAGATIVIAGDRITSVGDEAPAGAHTIDVAGAYVIPGLFDLHAHVMQRSVFFPGGKDPQETLRILRDSGITTIRCLPFFSESAHEWSAQVNTGRLHGPTLVTASGIFEKSAQRTSRGFGDPSTARAWVVKEALLGSQWIKVYNSMDEESLRAIVETARQYGMKVCGHAEDVPPLRASELGIGSVEHITSIPLSCMREDVPQPTRARGGLAGLTAARWAGADDAKLTALLDAFRRNGTAWVPTLVVCEGMLSAGHDGGPAPDEPTRQALRDAMRKAAVLAVRFHREGGAVGAGSDFPIGGTAPGISIHREMELLVEFGGATPIEALQIATISSASILGYQDILGSVESGKTANLVVIRENPLEDVSRTRDIVMVVHDGRVASDRR